MKTLGLWAMVVVVAVLAFLVFGPIGLGTGPLRALTSVAGWSASGSESTAALHLALIDHGGTAVLSNVTVAGTSAYPAPHATGESVQSTDCCDVQVGPVGGPTCGGTLRSASGAEVPAGSNTASSCHSDGAKDENVVVDVTVPSASCTIVSEITLHYREGWRHYASSTPENLVACGARTSKHYRELADAYEAKK